jgi:hypothetical protein
MRYWVYKCNSKNMPVGVNCGDWDYVFRRRKKETEWGSEKWTRNLKKVAVGVRH